MSLGRAGQGHRGLGIGDCGLPGRAGPAEAQRWRGAEHQVLGTFWGWLLSLSSSGSQIFWSSAHIQASSKPILQGSLGKGCRERGSLAPDLIWCCRTSPHPALGGPFSWGPAWELRLDPNKGYNGRQVLGEADRTALRGGSRMASFCYSTLYR